MRFINISGLNKAEVFRVLYNAAIPEMIAILGSDGIEISRERAKQIVKKEARTNFDRWGIKVLRINIANDVLDSGAYNRANGEGVAEKAIRSLRH